MINLLKVASPLNKLPKCALADFTVNFTGVSLISIYSSPFLLINRPFMWASAFTSAVKEEKSYFFNFMNIKKNLQNFISHKIRHIREPNFSRSFEIINYGKSTIFVSPDMTLFSYYEGYFGNDFTVIYILTFNNPNDLFGSHYLYI